ncbi:hypothetical protein OIU79_017617 [Salix purpurea]|uniref:Uncharacterized protein n=1 Tax=Salix purpurea TaxID=77065 RepID=A0A9Q0WW10_SALPP|nr:hypothetical protein OIU79_017617 [Salix purpurea]
MFDSLPWGHLLGGVLQLPSCSWELYCLLWVAVQIGWKLLLFLLWTDLEAVQLCCLSFSSLKLWRVTCMDCMAEALCVLAADLKVVCGRKGSPCGLGLELAGGLMLEDWGLLSPFLFFPAVVFYGVWQLASGWAVHVGCSLNLNLNSN